MKCPLCNSQDSRVLDSRPIDDGASIKRRRECISTTSDDLRRINGYVEEALKHATFTAVGPRDGLEKIEGVERILEI